MLLAGTFHLDYKPGDTVSVGFSVTPDHATVRVPTTIIRAPLLSRHHRDGRWGQVAETDSRGKPVGMQDSVTMLPSDKVITMRIFLDTVSS